jgi:serine/threonine-protein kinase
MIIAGRYELGERLGSGGMATVYLAEDRTLDRQVAVKVLDERYASDPSFVERFRREASAAAGLGHPNIVAVYDRGEAEGTYYIVMEYIDGPDLKEVIRARAPLPPEEAVGYARQILAALEAAHRRGIVHRDIKPQNVMVGEDGRLKVTDFGIARAGAETGMTEAGSVIGTAQYLSPEQARGDDVTPSSDCYAAGIVLYEMLTGRVPFDGERPVTVAMKQIHEPPVPPRTFERAIPAALEEVVLVSLAKRPAERFADADEMSRALAAALGGQPTGATAVIPPAQTAQTEVMRQQPTQATRVVAPPPADEPPPGRRRWPIWVAALAILLLAGVAAALLLNGGGGATVTVPDVRGQQVGDAVRELQDAGLSTAREDVEGSGQEPGTVVDQDPSPDAEVEEGTTVTLQVAAGPGARQVPDVEGETLDSARRILVRAGFEVAVTREQSDDVAEDVVISQRPGPGEEAEQGSTVTLLVSSGPGTVQVPDVTNQSQSSAEAELQDAGLAIGSVSTEENDQLEPGTVISQNPAAGTEVDEGSAVNLVVAIEAESVTVPNVVGSDAGSAGAELSAAGLTFVSEGAASEQPEGTVLGQSPSAGSSVPAGSSVALTVSLGPTKEEPPVDTGPSGGGTTTAPGTTTQPGDGGSGEPLP